MISFWSVTNNNITDKLLGSVVHEDHTTTEMYGSIGSGSGRVSQVTQEARTVSVVGDHPGGGGPVDHLEMRRGGDSKEYNIFMLLNYQDDGWVYQ